MIMGALGPPIIFYCHGCNANIFYKDDTTQLDQFYATVHDPLLAYLSYLYCCLCLIFLSVAVYLIKTLKLAIPKFYQEYRCVLWTASILLSLPLSFRGILDLSANDSSKFLAFFTKTDQRTLAYNISFFLLTTYFPVFCQISSLVFGFIRRKKAKDFENQTK